MKSFVPILNFLTLKSWLDKAIGMKIIDSGPRPRGGRVAASKFHYLGQMSKKFIILKILPIFKNFVNFFSDNPIMFGLKMIGLIRAF